MQKRQHYLTIYTLCGTQNNKKNASMKPVVVQKKSSATITGAKQPSKRQGPRHRQLHPIVKKLTHVPYQKPILKDEYNNKRYRDNFRTHPIDPEIASKYVGVSYDMIQNQWRAQMMIDGKVVNLGCYMDEDEAGSMYAKAAHQYKSRTVDVGIYGGLDLRAVPNQPLILRPNHETAPVKYKGVKANKKRWQAQITIKGDRCRHLGTFDTMEEAAQIYAKAVYYLEQAATTTTTTKQNDTSSPTKAAVKIEEIYLPRNSVKIEEEYFRCPV